MSAKTKKIVPLIILVLSLLLVYFFFDKNVGEVEKILNINIIDFVVISLIVGGTIIINGLKNKVLVKSFGINLKISEWFGLSVVNSFWNYLPFQGGLVAKGAYLKKKHEFPYTSYLAVVIASYMITFLVYGFLGCLGLLIGYINSFSVSPIILLIYLFLFLVPLIIVIFLRYSKNIKFSWNILQQLYQGIKIIFSKRTIIIYLILIDALAVVIFTLRLGTAGYVLGFDIPLLFYFLVTPLALLAIFTSITPGGLVIREAIIGVFAGWTGVQATESVAASVLDRGVSMIWIFIFGIFFNYYLSKDFLKRAKNNLD